MNKALLAVLALATVGVLVFTLMPSSTTPVRRAPVDAPAADEATPTAGSGAPTADDPGAAAKAAEAAPAVGGQPKVETPPEPKGRYTGDPTPRPKLEVAPPPALAPPLVGLPEGEIRNGAEATFGRKPEQPIPSVPVADLKATVRRYYGNLPRSGRFPARITVEELFPPAVALGLNVPPGSQVVEVGHYPTTGAEGLVEALELPEDGQGMLGVTVVTPDGQRIRDYIETQPAE